MATLEVGQTSINISVRGFVNLTPKRVFHLR